MIKGLSDIKLQIIIYTGLFAFLYLKKCIWSSEGYNIFIIIKKKMFKLDFPRRQYNIISNNYFKTFTNYFGMNMKTYNKMLN